MKPNYIMRDPLDSENPFDSIDYLIERAIENSVQDKEVGVLLSGGVDSLSVAFACHRLGKIVNAYSFRLDVYTNYDNNMAIKASEKFGWNHTECFVETSELERDFIELVTKYHCRKKTQFECVFPFLYVYPKIKEKTVLSGFGADGYIGVDKKACIHFSKAPLDKFNEHRDEHYQHDKIGGLKWHNYLAHNYNKIHYTPYLDPNIKNFYYSKDWQEVNKPKQKHHVRKAYRDEFAKLGKVKTHANLQIESGVNKVFESLLDSEKINFKNRSRIMDICKDWTIRIGEKNV